MISIVFFLLQFYTKGHKKVIGNITVNRCPEIIKEHDCRLDVDDLLCAEPFFQGSKCPKPKKVYTLFDAIFTELRTIPNIHGVKDCNVKDLCCFPDVVYLLDVAKGLNKMLIDRNLAIWFLKLYVRFLENFNCQEDDFDANFDECPFKKCNRGIYKLKFDDFIACLTDTACKRRILLVFLNELCRDIRNAIRNCKSMPCSSMFDDLDDGCTSGRCGSGSSQSSKKKSTTNFELYLTVIELFIKKLKCCINDRSIDPLCSVTTTCSYVLALPANVTVAGVAINTFAFISAGIISVPDPACNQNTTNTCCPPNNCFSVLPGTTPIIPLAAPLLSPLDEVISSEDLGNGNGKSKKSKKDKKNGNGNASEAGQGSNSVVNETSEVEPSASKIV